MRCAICETKLGIRWSDTHGVGVCLTCGLPYRIYHYDGDTRVEKPPEVAIKPEWIDIGRRYWQETKGWTFPAAYDFLRGRGGLSYSGASDEDIEMFNEWLDMHKNELPQEDSIE